MVNPGPIRSTLSPVKRSEAVSDRTLLRLFMVYLDRFHTYLYMRKKRTRAARATRLTVAQLKPVVLRVAKSYGVSNVRVFGSFARGEQRKSSDLDLLIDVPDGMSLMDLSGLKIDLEDALRRKVDVVPARSIKPALRETILAEARPL